MDYEAALEAVNEWLDRLDLYAGARSKVGRTPAVQAEIDEHDRWLNERLPLMQLISSKLYPATKSRTAVHKYAGLGNVAWLGTREHVLQIRGFLSQQDDYRTIFATRGPQLSASALHPWVWDAAKHLWSDSHYRSAVANAATQIEIILQSKIGRANVSGSKLIGEAFSLTDPKPGKARLRFPGLDPSSERFRSAHLGAMHLGQGCFEGIRNWAAHTLEEEDEQTALEFIATLSVFARWVDLATVAVLT